MWWGWGDNFLNNRSFSPGHRHHFPPAKTQQLWPRNDRLQRELLIPGAPHLSAFLTCLDKESYLPMQQSNKKEMKKVSETSTLLTKMQLPLLRPAWGLGLFWVNYLCFQKQAHTAPGHSWLPLCPSGRASGWGAGRGRALLPKGSQEMSCCSCACYWHNHQLPPSSPTLFFLFIFPDRKSVV